MAKGPTKEQISRLRWLSITALTALFVADYGFDIFKKEVPSYAYIGLIGISLGVDLRQLREVFITFLKSWVGANDDSNPKK